MADPLNKDSTQLLNSSASRPEVASPVVAQQVASHTTSSVDPIASLVSTKSTLPRLREPLPVVRLGGVDLHAVSEVQAIDHILNELAHGYGGIVVTPNLDHLRRCRNDMNFAALVSEAEVVVADGMPLIWASRMQGAPLPQRVAGSDLILSLSGACATAGRSIYLLGGAPGTA
jgi:UDP-N-acetyl-D-mannosaminuronic acid transferase (WecB/TagA/CpsF family)